MLAVFVHPFKSVPVTVYDWDADGVNGFPFDSPPFHEYVWAPPLFKTTLLPAQTELELAVAVTEGNEFTVMCFVILSFPLTLVTTNFILCVPAVL